MKQYYKLKDANGWLNLTEGRVYEGLNEKGGYVDIKNDVDKSIRIYASRFDKILNPQDAIELLKGELHDLDAKKVDLHKKIQEIEDEIAKGKPQLGNRYSRKDSGEYIVAMVTNTQYALISLVNGNRWTHGNTNINDIFGGYDDFIKL